MMARTVKEDVTAGSVLVRNFFEELRERRGGQRTRLAAHG